MKLSILAITAFLLVSGHTAADECIFHFSGTLAGDTRCPPGGGGFCGPYTGTLAIDDDQDAVERIAGHAYYYRYTEAKILFADGQTVTSHSPGNLPPKQSAIAGAISRLRVETSGDYLQITIDMRDPEATFGVIALRYLYDRGAFDPANLHEVLDVLQKDSSKAEFLIVGGICAWGPCIDVSLTPLHPETRIKID